MEWEIPVAMELSEMRNNVYQGWTFTSWCIEGDFGNLAIGRRYSRNGPQALVAVLGDTEIEDGKNFTCEKDSDFGPLRLSTLDHYLGTHQRVG